MIVVFVSAGREYTKIYNSGRSNNHLKNCMQIIDRKLIFSKILAARIVVEVSRM